MPHNIECAEGMAEKRKRKKEKVARWLKEGDRGYVKRDAQGKILPVKQHYKKLPRETPPGRNAKLNEFEGKHG